MKVNEGRFFEATCPVGGDETTNNFSELIELVCASCKASYSVVFSAGDNRVGAIIDYPDAGSGNTQSVGFKIHHEFEAGAGTIQIKFYGEPETPERLVKGIILRTQ